MIKMTSGKFLTTTLLKVLEIRNYTGNNIEPAALDLYKCLYTVAKSDIMYIYLYLRISHKERDIRISRNFKIILLSSFRHSKIYNGPQIDCIKKSFIYLIVIDILESLDPLDYKTLYLLKILNWMIQKWDSVSGTDKLILKKLYILCYATSLAPLRSLSVKIINVMELKNDIKEVQFKPFLNISLITNFEDSRCRFAKIRMEDMLQDMEEYMKFTHKFFHFNVHNKTAGIVYKSIISRFNINEFQEYIWPYWRRCLQKEIEKREFSQSLVKYWIPFTVDCYGIDLFIFLCTQKITQSFLLDIIYELRRKKHIPMASLCEGVILENLLCCLQNKNTFEKSIEIFCIFPVLSEKIAHKFFEIVEKYILGDGASCIHFEKSMNRLLDHIFITEHVNSAKSSYKFLYDDFISKLSEYIVENLCNRKNMYMSIKLCKNLIEIMKKPSEDFNLLYDLPKSLAYGFRENRYFLYLEKQGIFDLLTTKKKIVTEQLIAVFNEGKIANNTIIYLLTEEFNYFNVEDLKMNRKITENISLHNLEKHKFHEKMILHKIHKESPEVVYQNYLKNLVDKIIYTLPNMKISDINIYDIYEILKDLNVLVTGYEIKICVEDSLSCSLGLIMLDFMVGAVECGSHEGLSIKTRKVVEYLFCSIIQLLGLSEAVRKKHVISIFKKLIILIEKSNIRKLVTDALNLTIMLSEEMEASRCFRIRKAKRAFFVELVDSICNLNALESSKMRKHPRMRALLHAICKGSGQNQKQYVDEAICRMMVKLQEDHLNSAIQTVILECLEILIAEPCFHQFIFIHAEKIIELSLKSFESQIWTVKNAAIQLTNVVVSRFFGIQQNDTVRLRSFQEFCILFPNLTDNFFEILSRPTLDEKAIVILQYIAASEVLVYEHLDKKTAEKIQSFLFLFENLLISSESFVIKFIPQAFVSLCSEKDFSNYLAKISNFVITYLDSKPSNIIVNHLLLFKEFIRKINHNYSLLKNIEINLEISIVNTVVELNDFLRVKTAPYLDLLNIRCFSLIQYCSVCTCDIQLDIPTKKWYLANFIHNLCDYQFSSIFYYLNHEKKFNFLLDSFLGRYLNFVFEKGDLNLISEMSNLILNELFLIKSIANVITPYKVLIETILKITTKFEDQIILDVNIPENIENFNLYEAIAIQIILANRNDLDEQALCIESFRKITELRHFCNFDLEMLSQILLVVQKNFNSIDKYVFLKFVLYRILSDCEEEDIVKLITRLGIEYVTFENCANKLLTYDFLYGFLGEQEIVLKFLKSAMNLIKKFEKNLNICTFYLDTFDNLQECKNIVEKLIEEINNYRCVLCFNCKKYL